MQVAKTIAESKKKIAINRVGIELFRECSFSFVNSMVRIVNIVFLTEMRGQWKIGN